MTAAKRLATLTPYTAFTNEDGKPPAFAVFSSDEAIVFPYAHLYGVGWLTGDGGQHQILLEHRFFRLYLHGNHLEPLLECFERFTVRKVHVFDSGRHEPAGPGAPVVTHIDDHYEK